MRKKILILAPHTDDAEFGMGGTIARLCEEGHEVWCAAFSACRISLPENLDPNILISEVKEATAFLGIAPERLVLFDYDVRTFSYRRQEILEDILSLKNSICPDLVFMPSVNDIHQDHYTIAQEGIRAFKFSSLLCYELPWNNFSFQTSCFYTLTEQQLNQKIAALKIYRSQAHRPYADESFIRALAITRGTQIGVPFAECFEVVRMIHR